MVSQWKCVAVERKNPLVRLVTILFELKPCDLGSICTEHRRVSCALLARGELLGLGRASDVDDVDLAADEQDAGQQECCSG